MSERPSQNDHIAQALESHLHFINDGEWVYHDDFERIGGSDLFEWLPARIRVSNDGNIFEMGVRIDDLKKLFELTTLVGKHHGTTDEFIQFWNEANQPKFATYASAEWIYLRQNIQPTVQGLEQEYQGMVHAYDVTLSGIMEGKSFKQLSQSSPYLHKIHAALHTEGYGVLLFDELGLHNLEQVRDQLPMFYEEPLPSIQANVLGEFPLNDPEITLNFAPGTIRIDQSEKQFDNFTIQAYNGEPVVNIFASTRDYDLATETWRRDDVSLSFQIPPDESVLTIQDLEKLSVVHFTRANEAETLVDEIIPVQIAVSDHDLFIASVDGTIDVVISMPCCFDCGIPNWQFPQNTPPHSNAAVSIDQFYTRNDSLGIAQYITHFDGESHTFCGDCIDGAIETYIKTHEYADDAIALQRIRAELDDLGYSYIRIIDGALMRTDSGWNAITSYEYERDGRKIIRFTGLIEITDDGVLELHLQPKSYIDFQ